MTLPEGWIAKTSSSTGKTYYINSLTNQSQWDVPTEAAKKLGNQVQCAHLLVKHSGSRRPSSWKESNITRSKQEALEILQGYQKRIESGEITLQELARTESDCGSARNDGDLGFFGPGQMQKPFEEVSFALDVGQLSGVVDTDSGLHLIQRIA